MVTGINKINHTEMKNKLLDIYDSINFSVSYLSKSIPDNLYLKKEKTNISQKKNYIKTRLNITITDIYFIIHTIISDTMILVDFTHKISSVFSIKSRMSISFNFVSLIDLQVSLLKYLNNYITCSEIVKDFLHDIREKIEKNGVLQNLDIFTIGLVQREVFQVVQSQFKN